MSAEDWKILSKVYQLLLDGNVFNTPDASKIVEFAYPDELQKIIEFSIEPDSSPLDVEGVEQLCKTITKYSVKTGHRHFYNQLFGGYDPFGLAGSWITEALNTSQYTFEVAPVFTLIEDAVIKKALELFCFKDGDGIFSPGGSISNMYGMVIARFKRIPDVKNNGLFSSAPLVAFTSDDAHYSIKKGMHWLGMGINNLIHVKTDSMGRMIPEELEKEISKVRIQGRIPFFVNATCGTTVLGAFDDLEAIADVCKRQNVWMHVDACFGGTALLSTKHSDLLKGIQRADSATWNPHKTLGAPLQCAIFLVKEKKLLHKANCANATYLFQQDKFYDVSYDTGDKSLQCGRKVNAFKLWLMFKARGQPALGKLVDNAKHCADYLKTKLSATEGFKLVIDDFQFTNICFWYIPKKMRNQKQDQDWWNEIYKIPPMIKEKMIKKGNLMIGYSPLHHKNIGNFFRMALTCHPPMTEQHMDYIITEITKMGEEIYSFK